MQLFFTERFKKSYRGAPEEVQKSFDKQANYLMVNIRHPSLRAKKYDESYGIWQARVNKNWRFYFLLSQGGTTLLDIISHPK